MKTFKEPLTPEQEQYYLEKFAQGDNNAKDILIESNLRLVAHVAKKYFGERDNEDLISIGIIGLIKAVNSFDVTKGNRLGTYAAKCIENELLMMLRSEKKRNKEVSLNEPIGTDKEGNALCYIDVMEAQNEDILQSMENEENIKQVREIVQTQLSDRERDIIERRFGLNGRKSETQRVIGKDLNISRSYVSRIEKRALGKIRKCMEANNN